MIRYVTKNYIKIKNNIKMSIIFIKHSLHSFSFHKNYIIFKIICTDFVSFNYNKPNILNTLNKYFLDKIIISNYIQWLINFVWKSYYFIFQRLFTRCILETYFHVDL